MRGLLWQPGRVGRARGASPAAPRARARGRRGRPLRRSPRAAAGLWGQRPCSGRGLCLGWWPPRVPQLKAFWRTSLRLSLSVQSLPIGRSPARCPCPPVRLQGGVLAAPRDREPGPPRFLPRPARWRPRRRPRDRGLCSAGRPVRPRGDLSPRGGPRGGDSEPASGKMRVAASCPESNLSGRSMQLVLIVQESFIFLLPAKLLGAPSPASPPSAPCETNFVSLWRGGGKYVGGAVQSP